MAISIPGDIEDIFDKPGRDWTPEERVKVVVWLNSNPQLQYLRLVASRRLGSKSKPEDAEDAWHEFCVKRLNRVIDNYDPAEGRRFWDYLLYCFRRFCDPKREKIERRTEVQLPVSEDGELEFEFADQNEDVERSAEQNEQRLHILRCVNKLPADLREVVNLRHFMELSVKETAKTLGISEALVKQRAFRAREKLRRWLR